MLLPADDWNLERIETVPIVYEDDALIETRAKAITKLASDLDLLNDTIRMLSERGCSVSVRKGLRNMQIDWTAQLDIMRAHNQFVTPASQKPSERAPNA